MTMAQKILERVASGDITPAVLDKIGAMSEDQLARLLEKETFKQASESLALSDFALCCNEIANLEGLEGLFSKIKKCFKRVARKVKKEVKRVSKKVTKELKRPGVWKALSVGAAFIPGVGPLAAGAIATASKTVAGVREARMIEKEEAKYAQMPPEQIQYISPSPAQVSQSIASLTQVATPYTISAMKQTGMSYAPQAATPVRPIQPPPTPGLTIGKILPFALPAAFLLLR